MMCSRAPQARLNAQIGLRLIDAVLALQVGHRGTVSI